MFVAGEAGPSCQKATWLKNLKTVLEFWHGLSHLHGTLTQGSL
jgi:hypothetical protein